MNLPKVVKCPNCAKSVEWSDAQPWRPFCCERCKLIDLGAWAGSSYSVPGKEQGFAENEPEDH